VVTTVGRLTAIKQHDLLLEAISLLATKSPDLVLLIVGDGELRQALESEVAARGLQRTVRFLGWRGDLERVYAATDVFVLTSRNEGTPVALIEAMASGLPAVSTDVGGVRDVVVSPDAGSLVPFGDAGALADALQRYAESAAIRETVGRAARVSVGQRFTLQRLVADIRVLYDELLERPH
jgi:glycosyltransferase involved in cell wall biosynthesis